MRVWTRVLYYMYIFELMIYKTTLFQDIYINKFYDKAYHIYIYHMCDEFEHIFIQVGKSILFQIDTESGNSRQLSRVLRSRNILTTIARVGICKTIWCSIFMLRVHKLEYYLYVDRQGSRI